MLDSLHGQTSTKTGGTMDLRGRTAIITGASAGIGRATAIALATEGVDIAITARTTEALEATAAAALEHGVRVLAVPGDVTDRDHVRDFVASALEEFGKIDILVNNAALHTRKRSLAEIGAERWDRVVAVNFTAPFDFAREVVPAMRKAGGGVVINVCSDAATIPDRTHSGVAYGASKAALAAFTQSIRCEEWTHGIRATAIFPGETDTDMIGLRPDGTSDERRAVLQKPEDIAAAVVFAAGMPARANVSEIVVQSTMQRT
ncbi:MAG: short-chain dehydrogenase [Gemmatimonadaceae bacterium]|nr:short-chain dehydrogenase [Gemmatimonadaceae bacterium]